MWDVKKLRHPSFQEPNKKPWILKAKKRGLDPGCIPGIVKVYDGDGHLIKYLNPFTRQVLVPQGVRRDRFIAKMRKDMRALEKAQKQPHQRKKAS